MLRFVAALSLILALGLAKAPVAMAGYCGSGIVASGQCEDSTLCCSTWGWCNECAEGQIPHIAPQCGGGIVGNGQCADPSWCCSDGGFCEKCASENVPTPVAVPSPVQSPIYSNTPCGDGIVGNGECGYNLCCSDWGYCRDSCPLEEDAPTVSPAPTIAPVPIASDDTRLVAFMGNWQACPTAEQFDSYTHIIVSFAVTYTWGQGRNTCSETCEISEPTVCGNDEQPELVSQWQSMGKKVMISFGGAGMGTTYNVDNDCWEYCYGKEKKVVKRLVDISKRHGFDGVDIDFEYHVTPEAATFLNEVTIGLKNSLPAGSLITHTPMDLEIEPGKEYYEKVLKKTGRALDFLMPQYYNGDYKPGLDGIEGIEGSWRKGSLGHYTDLVDNIYGGDPTRIVFGFCIAECSDSGSNINKDGAIKIMTDLANYYPCNGGAFFWAAYDDWGGQWSSPVSSTIQSLSAKENGCGARAPASSPPRSPTNGGSDIHEQLLDISVSSGSSASFTMSLLTFSIVGIVLIFVSG